MKDCKISIIGGDMRSCAAALYIQENGYETDTFLLDDTDCLCDRQKCTAFPRSDYYLLPLPFSSDGIYINSPLSNTRLDINDFLLKIPDKAVVFGGMLSTSFKEKLKERGIKFVDYYDLEEVKIKNAVPTAEGAIEIALRELPVTLSGTKSLLIGYGRITRVLAPMLLSFGSAVTVSSRTPEGMAWSSISGFKTVNTGNLKDVIGTYDIIFNTSPSLVIDGKLLGMVRPDCLIIDLASKPGGVDMEKAASLGVHVIWALGLPGKCAPITAGRIIGETMLNMIN